VCIWKDKIGDQLDNNLVLDLVIGILTEAYVFVGAVSSVFAQLGANVMGQRDR
jgi:hypothetical protein